MRRNTFMLLALCFSLLFSAGKAMAAGEDDARQFVDTMGKHVLAIINGNIGEQQKQQQLRQMFTDNVDIAWMGQFVLGRGWHDATDAQKSQYLEAYKQYLLARYTNNFADYAGSQYAITGVTHDEDDQFTVAMQITSPNGRQQNTEAGYRIRLENGQFKIVDIIVEGVSLITTQRSDFASALQQHGMAGLISVLQEKANSTPVSVKGSAPQALRAASEYLMAIRGQI